MTMQLYIHFPESFPLHGIERDAFETKLRDALHHLFDGHRVRELADQIDRRRAFEPSGILPLRRIGDEYTFERCLTLDRCRVEDMSIALRRMILNAVSARLGLDLMERRVALPSDSEQSDATNCPSPSTPANRIQRPRTAIRIGVGVAMTFMAAAGAATAWWMARALTQPMVATVVSTSPAQTLRELAGSMPENGPPYRISVQVEPETSGPLAH
ncbi:MAG TPA: hypothetical protein VJU59_04185 [Paraburkholderia sp.]|uniref:hypothetical protein n=1 Tax=Paraburkholderia sp. TaxID=1926495 RepID=UPI002B47A8C1|nr:hypothetical protein [Paraburkholderia sp.]HKR38870.1 hypothetical protein [Paraburkholderia sp.]